MGQGRDYCHRSPLVDVGRLGCCYCCFPVCGPGRRQEVGGHHYDRFCPGDLCRCEYHRILHHPFLLPLFRLPIHRRVGLSWRVF